ncbi:MAG: alcohol dehydrogenase [Methylococcaceae bacterium]|nr:alcohol dehydrogenase [Methylococcaceae bacterium]
MQGLWLDGGRLTYRDDLPVPRPAAGEALIRVRLAGICGTDLQLLAGYYPFEGIPGHEFVGEVVTAADPGWVGQRVVGEINLFCGRCATCAAGRHRHCERRSVLGIRDHHGAFAEYLTLPVLNLHRIPDSVPDEKAVFTEPLAAALQIQSQVAIGPDQRVLLIGAGRLGQLIAPTLALTGCQLEVSARYPTQRRLLRAQGIPTLEADEIPATKYDIAIEATGSADGFREACRAVRPAGTIVLKSTYRDSVAVDLAKLVVDEIRVVGSRCGDFGPALDLLERGLIDPAGLIAERLPLNDGPEAFRNAALPGALKVLLAPLSALDSPHSDSPEFAAPGRGTANSRR